MVYRRKGRSLKFAGPLLTNAAKVAARGIAKYAARKGLSRLAKNFTKPKNIGKTFRRRTPYKLPTGPIGGGYRKTTVNPQGELQGPIKVTKRVRKLNPQKLTSVSLFKRILRWQDVNAMNRPVAGIPPGAIQLKNASTATETECPVHFFLLNSTVNTTTAVAGAHYTLQVLDNGTLNFAVRNSRAPSGALAANAEWQFEWRNNVSSGSTGKRYIIPQWYDIRLLCYGARSQPTQYEISLIKFKDDYLDPLENPSSTQEAADRQALYQNLAQTMMYNPILPSHGTYLLRSKMRILKRVRFTLQPSLTTEVDTTPTSKIVRMFIPDNKVYDYLYHADPFTGAASDDKLNTQQWVNTGTLSTDYSEIPQSRQRLWLMIRCLDTTIDAVNESNTPSYDICVRKKEAMSPD